jgi:hypothetical protein
MPAREHDHVRAGAQLDVAVKFIVLSMAAAAAESATTMSHD